MVQPNTAPYFLYAPTQGVNGAVGAVLHLCEGLQSVVGGCVGRG